MAVLILPLAIYSLYSVISHVRSEVRLYQHPLWRQYCHGPSEQLVALQSTAMDLATQLEILALPWLLISFLSTGLVLPLVYASYLRWQYMVSGRIRLAFAAWDAMLSRVTENPACPKPMRRFYARLQTYLKKSVRPPVLQASRVNRR